MRRTGMRAVLCRAAHVAAAALAGCAGAGPRPPGQPASGPGGTDYHHAAVTRTLLGNGRARAWVYEPARPRPRRAPVVVLLHSWGAMRPAYYARWIRHLVRRGNIVLYPRFQSSLFSSIPRMPASAKAAVRSALAELRKGEHVTPDIGRLVVVGHSIGGIMAMNFAAEAERDGLPPPRAVMCIQPGEPKHGPHSIPWLMPIPSILGDYSKVPVGTLVLVIVGEDDWMTGDVVANLIWNRIRHLPANDRDFVTVLSDDHGSPSLDATHFFPLAPDDDGERTLFGSTDALDYYGTWKLLDALIDAACRGTHRRFALGNTPEQRFMGLWGDGVPVRELRVRNRRKKGDAP